jgi:hypothetical protein
MQGRIKGKSLKRRVSFRENTIAVLGGVLAFVLLIVADNIGISKKWVTAALGTIFAFSFVIYAFRRKLLRWSFWAAFVICLAVHVLFIWLFFYYVLRDFQRFSILFWMPIVLIETVVLLVAVKRVEEKFTGQHESMKLDI